MTGTRQGASWGAVYVRLLVLWVAAALVGRPAAGQPGGGSAGDGPVPVVACDGRLAVSAFSAWASYQITSSETPQPYDPAATVALPRPFNACPAPERYRFWRDAELLPTGVSDSLRRMDAWGYRAVALRYGGRDDGLWLLAYRGTATGRGWLTDGQQLLWDGEPLQYVAARETAVRFATALGAGRLTGGRTGRALVTGHSLGGGLATWASQFLREPTVRTYNAAHLNPVLRGAVVAHFGRDTAARFRNYRVDRDFVSMAGPGLVGPVVTLPLPPGDRAPRAHWPHPVAVLLRAAAWVRGDPGWATAEYRVQLPTLGTVLDASTDGAADGSATGARAHVMGTVLRALSRDSTGASPSDPGRCIARYGSYVAHATGAVLGLALVLFGAPALGRQFRTPGRRAVTAAFVAVGFVVAATTGGPNFGTGFLVMTAAGWAFAALPGATGLLRWALLVPRLTIGLVVAAALVAGVWRAEAAVRFWCTLTAA